MNAGVPNSSASATTSHPPTSRWPRSLTRLPSGYTGEPSTGLARGAAAIPLADGLSLDSAMVRHCDETPPSRRDSFAPAMRLPSPRAAARRGVHENRPYELWLPETPPPWPGVVVLHGAGSRKENHGDFARAATGYGWAALTFDQRGHGASEDEMSPAAIGDVTRMARLLAAADGVDTPRGC